MPIFTYQLDPTGLSSNNLVQNEAHTLTTRTRRLVAANYGGFFTESMRVYDAGDSNRLLTRGVEYYAVELFEVPTAKYGKEICALVEIINSAVSNNITMTYQALGGEYSTSAVALRQAIDNLTLDNRPASWPDILSKPSDFPPTHHLHDAGDIYGFEYVVHALERIRAAIELGDQISHDQIYAYINNTLTLINGITPQAVSDLIEAHAAAANPHQKYVRVNGTQTFTDPEKVQGRSNIDAELVGAGTAAVTTHTSASDPHPQYVRATGSQTFTSGQQTQARANISAELSGAAGTAVSAHVALTDAHTNYVSYTVAQATDSASQAQARANTGAEVAGAGLAAVATHASAANPHLNYVRTDAAQGLTSAQQIQARANINAEVAGTGSTSLTAHVSAANPHTQYVRNDVNNQGLSSTLQGNSRTNINAEVAGAAVSTMSTHVSAVDPHTQYVRSDVNSQSLSTTAQGNARTNINAELAGTAASSIATHTSASNPHSQYVRNDAAQGLNATLQGIARSNIGAEVVGTAGSTIVTHTSAADPHPQYVRSDIASQGLASGLQSNARTNIGAEASGAAASAVTAHEAATHPHAQYVATFSSQGLNTTQRNAARANIGAELSGAGTSAVNTHTSSTDPHAQYVRNDVNTQGLNTAQQGNARTNINAEVAGVVNNFVGAVFHFTATAAPTGFIKANGALLSRTTYAALWAYAQASGTLAASDAVWTSSALFGSYSPGDGSTTFRIPDLRGYHLRSSDDGRGVDSSRQGGTSQGDSMPSHFHTISDPAHYHSILDPGHNHYQSVYTRLLRPPYVGSLTGSDTTGGGSEQAVSAGDSADIVAAVTGVYMAGAYTGINSTNTAGGGIENRVKNIALLACIRY